MRYLLETAVELVGALVKDEPYALEEKLEEARRLIARTELGPSTRAIVEAARRRDIPWFRVNADSLVQLGYGKNRRFIQAAMTSETGGIAVEIAGDKELTKTMLEQADIPVPRGLVAETADEAVAALSEIGGAVVVKPLDGHQGKGVSLNLTTEIEVLEAFRIAQAYGHDVLVEEMYAGRDYRALVVGGKLVAASERVPCHVVGDGEHTQRPARPAQGRGGGLARRTVNAESPERECLTVLDEIQAFSNTASRSRRCSRTSRRTRPPSSGSITKAASKSAATPTCSSCAKTHWRSRT